MIPASLDPSHQSERAGGPGLIPRATVESIVAARDAALGKCHLAYDRLDVANRAILEAREAIAEAAPDQIDSYTSGTIADRGRPFMGKIDLAPLDVFSDTARRFVDIKVWSHIVDMTDLQSVMDKQEKDALRADLQDNPPEITVDNIHATLRRFAADADTIWRRGLANSFAKLDRRFRSHSGWKLGGRAILDRAFDDRGTWNYRSNHEDTLIDIERVFRILDGDSAAYAAHSGIVAKLRDVRRTSGWGARQSFVESDFFRVRVFKNGNCHVWFKRDDLVEKANKVLAEYYGEVLADGEAHEQADIFEVKRTPARYFGHFPTPAKVAERLVGGASLYAARVLDEPLTILEPSAGAGNLASLAAANGCLVDCIEVQPHLAAQLENSRLYRRVIEADFLERIPAPTYDRVIMNPPFDRERDIDHVMHALGFLKPDGLLVAILSAGTEWRETRKARAFRDRIEALNGTWHDLPCGSFSEVGTNVNTVMVRVWADGRRQSHWW